MAKILVVDDDPDVRDLISEVLGRHELCFASGGEEACAVAASERPELIFLDLQLPDIPGTDVVQFLRDDAGFAEIPIVAITGHGAELSVDAMELGCNDYLLKPFSIQDLDFMVESFIPSTTDASV
ncbi:response regulator [Candidatus Hydrogenedentota bacterium]